MQRWELKRVFVPYRVTSRDGGYFEGELGDNGKARLDEADKLALEGWELVAVMPYNSGYFESRPGAAGGFSYTSGFLMFFKRPLP